MFDDLRLEYIQLLNIDIGEQSIEGIVARMKRKEKVIGVVF